MAAIRDPSHPVVPSANRPTPATPDELAAAADRRFPDRAVAPWALFESPDATRGRLDAVLTSLARGALALPVATPVDDRAVRSLVETIAHHPPLYWRGDETLAWGVLALLATAVRDWDMVVRCTGKRALGTRVQSHRDYDGDLRGLARHLATAVRSQLPALAVAPALRSLRARYAADRVKPDGRVAVIATRIFVEPLIRRERAAPRAADIRSVSWGRRDCLRARS